MKKRKRLTEATRAEIVRAYLAGESATSIRNRLGLGGMTVRHVVEAAGHEMRSRSAASASERDARLIRLWRDSIVAREIAGALGCGEQEARRRVWVLRKRGEDLPLRCERKERAPLADRDRTMRYDSAREADAMHGLDFGTQDVRVPREPLFRPEREPTWVAGGGPSVAPARAARAGRAA